jgi:hypothetical protein
VADEHYGPCSIAVDAQRVYWGNFDVSKNQPAKILTAPIVGGPAAALDDTGPVPLSDIAITETDLYWVGFGKKVVRVPLTGGSPTTVATGAWGASEIAVDDRNVYWTQWEKAGEGRWRSGVFYAKR